MSGIKSLEALQVVKENFFKQLNLTQVLPYSLLQLQLKGYQVSFMKQSEKPLYEAV